MWFVHAPKVKKKLCSIIIYEGNSIITEGDFLGCYSTGVKEKFLAENTIKSTRFWQEQKSRKIFAPFSFLVINSIMWSPSLCFTFKWEVDFYIEILNPEQWAMSTRIQGVS